LAAQTSLVVVAAAAAGPRHDYDDDDDDDDADDGNNATQTRVGSWLRLRLLLRAGFSADLTCAGRLPAAGNIHRASQVGADGRRSAGREGESGAGRGH